MRSSASRLILATALLSLLLPVELLAAGGTVEGKVIYTGSPKRNPLIQMGADPNCMQINAGKKVEQKMVALGPGQGIGNVFIHVTDDVPHAGGPPAQPVTIDQQGCIYHPRIGGAVTGQTLKITNSDNTLHNIHTQSDAGNGFNVGQPKAGMTYEHELRGEEVMLRLKCDVHPWMIGYLGVKKHPYFAVTGEDGSFKIENVPAGSYTLQAWQEVFKAQDQTITVEDGSTVTVEFAYGPPKSARSELTLPIRDLVVGGVATEE